MNYGSRSVCVPQAGLPSKSYISLGKEEGLDGKATYHPVPKRFGRTGLQSVFA